VNETGDHPSFGKVFLRPKSVKNSKVNLFSLGVLRNVKGSRITFNDKRGCFIVRRLDGVSYEFSCGEGNLFVCDMSDTIVDEQECL
jgi:hypothetical protein